MNPQESTKKLRSDLIKYFHKSFPLRKSLTPENDSADILGKIDAFLESEDTCLVQYPYIERQKPYKSSENTLNNVIGIEAETATAFARYFGGNVDQIRLYEHQENAFKAVSGNNDTNKQYNLVVCTGTGSGKTESFLLPVINAIVAERKQAGQNYQPGVRALILYPMNALVNDQIRRLRSIIRNIDEPALRPSFGLYTSEVKAHETEEDLDLTAVITQLNNGERNANIANYVSDDLPLPCEYTHRYQWETPADILVTNYSMLERLLLNPQTNAIFSPTWRFIVLDEAHSYTGSMGTEIAWLVRRLVHRTQAENLQFIATSATLRSTTEEQTPEENKQWIRDNFASKIFPAAANTFQIELGASAELETSNQAPYEGDLAELLDSHEDDFSHLVQLIADEKTDKSNRSLFPLMKKTDYTLDELAMLLEKFPDIPQNLEVVTVNDNIKNLIEFVFKVFGETDEAWKSELHDDLSPLDSNRQDSQGNPIYEGNRLDILDAWKDVKNERRNNLTVDTFLNLAFYAHQAINEFAETNVSVENLKVEITQELKDRKNTFLKEFEPIENNLAVVRAELTERWQALLGYEGESCKIENMLFHRLSNRSDVQCVLANVDRKAKSFMEIAEAVYPGDENQVKKLYALLQLAMIAQKDGCRYPLIDTRYHQLIRGISDVAVSFPDGEITNLQFSRSAEREKEGNILWTFGTCRECGHPFIMGYTADHQLTAPGMLLRNYTSQSRYLQVFSWAPGSEQHAEDKGLVQHAEDGQKRKDSDGPIYLDLKTGAYALAEQPGYTKMYWHRRAKSEKEPRFIAACPNCGSNRGSGRDKQTYGIITPYEAESEQVRLEILASFYQQSEPDTDQLIREMPGEGRKLLSFSDSRSGAAKIAYNFHKVFLQRFLASQISTIVADDNAFARTREERIKILFKTNPLVAGSWDLLPEDTKNTFLTSIPSKIAKSFINVSDILLKRMREKKFDYFLEAVDQKQPDQLLDAKYVARWLTMCALRDFARDGLIAGQKIKLKYDFSESDLDNTIDAWKLDGLFESDEITCFKENIEGLLQNIFRFIFKTVAIAKPDSWQEIDIHEDWKKNITWEPTFKDGYVETIGFKPQNMQHPNKILRYLNDFLKQVAPEKTIDNDNKLKLLQLIWKYFIDQKVLSENNGQYQLSLLVTQNLDVQGRTPDQKVDDSILGNKLLILPRDSEQELQEETIVPMRIEEHTAQLASKRGSNYQKAFASGRINILSCSTTFEMGIDLGGLNRVFLANMPPATANYKQRAGRAGRRPGAAAYILTFAGNQSHDIYYFDHPTELFDSEITPPMIYLDKPTFRARHLRAEALHDFLMHHAPQQNPNCYSPHKDWTKLNTFFLDYRAGRLEGNAGSKKARIINKSNIENDCTSPLISFLETWLTQRSSDCQNDLLSIPDVPELDYNVPEDLVFQLTGQHAPYPMLVENKTKFLNLCGPCLPEIDQCNTNLTESENPMRQSALQRIKNKFYLLVENNHNSNGFIEQQGEWYINGYQKFYLLNGSSIDAFSSYSVLPKYGFPVDVIELQLPSKSRNKNNVSLDRDLRVGLYEYAPGQQITADRNSYTSTGFRSHELLNYDKYRRCPACHTLLKEEKCPHCNIATDELDLKDVGFSRPEIFYSKTSSVNSFSERRGSTQQIYTGKILNPTQLTNVNISVGESDNQMMTYFNAGPDGNGFENGDKNYIFVHEIITNIAIWEIRNIPVFNDGQRAENAVLSAMYSIREAAAKILQVCNRDLGVLLQSASGCYRIILFDQAAGGGGLVLPLYDAANQKLIRQILEEAKKLCAECSCGGINAPEDSWELYSDQEYVNLTDRTQARRRQACAHCLKKSDNFLEHHKLDRWDAYRVLEHLLILPMAGAKDDEWEPVPENFAPVKAMRYRLADGRVIKFHPAKHSDLIPEIREKHK